MHKTEEYAIPYRKAITIVLLLTLCAALAVPPASSGTGSAVVGNQTPSLTSRTISTTETGANQTSSPDLTVYTYYWFWVTLSDANSMDDIANITITVYDSSGSSGVFDKQHSYGFSWQNASATVTWKELGAGGWGTCSGSCTYLADATSVQPTDWTSSSGTWKFKARMATVARNVAADDWYFKAEIKDVAAAPATATGAAWFDFNYYVDYSTAAGSVSWSGVNPGDTNSTASSPASGNNYVTVTAINHASHIQVEGDGALARTGGGGTSFPLANVYVGQTSNAATNDGKKLTTGYQTLWSSVAAGTESTNKAAYYFITVPNPCIAGTYTFTWYVQIITV